MREIIKNKTSLILVLSLAIFIASFLIHWYPVQKKGYPPSISPETLILARNLTQTGEYSSENNIGMVLNSDLIAEKGDDSIAYNKYSAVFYSYIFKIFGFNQNLPLYICLILFSLTGVILFILSFKLFNLPIALLQVLIFNLFPIISYASVYYGFYEWGIFLFSLGLLFYFWPKEKISLWLLLVAGLFFALASLSRSAFLLSVGLLGLYEFYKHKNIKRILIFALPIIIAWGIYLTPGHINNQENSYLSSSQERFSVYGHLFPDPYTFFFEKQQFLDELTPTGPNDLEMLIKLNQPLSFRQYVNVYFSSFTFYALEIIKIIIIGGPLIIFLIFLGLRKLYANRHELRQAFIFWLAGLYLLLVVLKTNNWDHFLEISFPLSLLGALGCYQLIKTMLDKKKFLIILFVLFLFGHLILANKWMYHEEYNTSNMTEAIEIAECINSQPINNEVIAVNIHPELPDYLNYYTNKNIIHFSQETINKLLNQGRLDQAFEKYDVRWIIGFDQEVAENIKNALPINNLAELCE